MQQLSELIKLLGKDFDFCTCNKRTDTTTVKLFNYLQGAERPTTQEAASCLGLKPTDPKFRKAKHLLKIEVLNLLTAIQVAEQSSDRRKRTYAYIWKLIVIAKQLRTSVGSRVLLPYLEEAFRLAVEQEMVDAAFQSATMLRRQYVNRNFDPEKFRLYASEATRYGDLSRSYQDVVSAFNDIVFRRNTRQPPQQIRERALAYHQRYQELIRTHDVAIISYIVYLLELNASLVVGDFAGVIRIANEAIDYLNRKPTAQPIMFQVFEANLSVAYTQLNDYERGTSFAKKLLAKTAPTDFNYLKVNELLLVLNLRAGKFQEAYETFIGMNSERFTGQLLTYYQETFRIIEAYLFLLIKMQQIEVAPDDTHFRRFRVSRFVNSLRHASSEKSHRNVHILIIQIVNGIIDRQHGRTAYSIEAITKYANRHLKGKGYQRVGYFLKALAQLSTQQFHRTAVERHTSRYIKLMQKRRMDESGLDYYMELIPYEMLWNLILEQLGFRRIRIRGVKRDE